jgi:hypothetical protein
LEILKYSEYLEKVSPKKSLELLSIAEGIFDDLPEITTENVSPENAEKLKIKGPPRDIPKKPEEEGKKKVVPSLGNDLEDPLNRSKINISPGRSKRKVSDFKDVSVAITSAAANKAVIYFVDWYEKGDGTRTDLLGDDRDPYGSFKVNLAIELKRIISNGTILESFPISESKDFELVIGGILKMKNIKESLGGFSSIKVLCRFVSSERKISFREIIGIK